VSFPSETSMVGQELDVVLCTDVKISFNSWANPTHHMLESSWVRKHL